MLVLPRWLQEGNTGLLVVALLLTMWLWLRLRRREDEAIGAAISRATPMSIDELGRFVFMAARSEDLIRYRGLFLNGAEARQVLNELARSYLEHRNYAALQRSLSGLSRQIPQRAIYDGIGEQQGRMLTIRIRMPGEQVNLLKVGTVTQIGSVWRLLEPHAGGR